jgi:hypothetical protein
MDFEFFRSTVGNGDSIVFLYGGKAASYGPRLDEDNEVRPPMAGEATEFWGVYIHDAAGLAECVVDVATEYDAMVLMSYIAAAHEALHLPQDRQIGYAMLAALMVPHLSSCAWAAMTAAEAADHG